MSTSATPSLNQDENTVPSSPPNKHVELEAIQRIEDEWRHAPENGLNWPSVLKWRMIAIISFQSFISPLASSTMAPGLPEIGEHYKISSPTVLALTLSIFLLAWSVGPLFMGPLSEVYGRRWVLNISNLIFLVFNIACIFAPNTSALIAFRFFAGIGASTPISIGGALVGDLFNERDRAPAVSAFLIGILLGPPTGPVIGGYIAQTVGFKYGFVVPSALAGVSCVLSFMFLRETYAPVLRVKRAQRQIAALESHADSNQEKAHQSVELESLWVELSHLQGGKRSVYMKEILWTSLIRPLQLLTRSFICSILSVYGALIYGYLNIFFTTLPTVFGDDYGFGPGATGLTYIGGGLGGLLATFLGGLLGNRVYRSLVLRNNGVSKPEFRIPAMIPGSIAAPVGLFWYGWSAQAGIHWIMPVIGYSIFGFGMMATYLSIQLYFVDAFTYSASALSASAVLRSLCAFAFPLFAPPMFAAMGLGGGYSFLAGLILIIGIPFPIWIYYYGERLRAGNPLNR